MLRLPGSFQPNLIPCGGLVIPPWAQLSLPSVFSPSLTLKLCFGLLCLTAPSSPIRTAPTTLFPVSLSGHLGSYVSSKARASPEFWVAPASGSRGSGHLVHSSFPSPHNSSGPLLRSVLSRISLWQSPQGLAQLVVQSVSQSFIHSSVPLMHGCLLAEIEDTTPSLCSQSSQFDGTDKLREDLRVRYAMTPWYGVQMFVPSASGE